jgi:heat shock protein HtpX
MSSFFDEIARNRLRSLLLMLLFGLFFLGIILLATWLLAGSGWLLFGLVIGAVVVALYAAFVYFLGDKAILRFSRAKEADKSKYPDLYSIVEGLASAAEIPTPKVYIINDPSPNAFATGKNKKASSIAVTTGLLGMMSREELTGVIAHEMSHVYNNDIQFMMIAVVFAGAIGLISIFLRNMLWFGGGRGRNGGYLMLAAFAIGILAPIFALLIRLAISRRREYMADANGARMIRDPAALASALKKIQAYTASPRAVPVQHANEMTASLYFSNPFRARSIANIFSTHPPIDERIRRLQQMY